MAAATMTMGGSSEAGPGPEVPCVGGTEWRC